MRWLLLGLLCIYTPIVCAQVKQPMFEKVAKKFEKGNFEAALESAEALIDKDKYRKIPEPYLWASMCFYRIHLSEDEKLKLRFKSALRDALKYAGKAVSKDKDGSFVATHSSYFDTLRKTGIVYAQQFETTGDYRKAQYTYKQIQKLAPTDPYVQFAKGVADIRMNSMYAAEKEIQESFPELETRYRNLAYKPNHISAPLLKPSVLYYAEHLMNSNYPDSARAVLLSARVFFPLDQEIKLMLQGL